jgi:hypothetical protein
MDKRSAQIATICECIDHCFAFSVRCEDFAPFLDPEDMMSGLDCAAQLVADATRLQSFLALRKLDGFQGVSRSRTVWDDGLCPRGRKTLDNILGRP